MEKEPVASPPQAQPQAQQPLRIGGVHLKIVGEGLGILQDYSAKLELTCTQEQAACRVCFHEGSKKIFEIKVREVSHVYQAGSTLVFLRVSQGSAVITLESQNDTSQLIGHLYSHLSPGHRKLKKQSVFSLRTEEASAKQYFQFYGYLSQQQNMMQDYVRTATYQSAVLQNTTDFQDKVVLDVGAGTGILSFFAIQAGARKVYAIEASSMAVHCLELVRNNRFGDKMVVIAGKLEEIDIPEKIDVIISEPMGYMLFNERMLESFIHARKWLKPGGKMYPTQGILFCAPFTDDALYMEQLSKANFWYQQSFYGVDLCSLRSAAMEEYLRQPILDTFDVRLLMAQPVGHTTDFSKASETDLHKITIPLTFKLWSSGTVHGLAFWFDVAFIGGQQTVWLSTAPFQPLTHWYQIRCLLRNPIFVRAGQEMTGYVQMTANERQSYDVDIEVSVTSTGIRSVNSYDLKNPNFRYMSAAAPPPGSHHSCPTETYWDQQGHASSQTQVPQPPTAHSVAQAYSHPPGQTIIGTSEVIPLVNGGVLSPMSIAHPAHTQTVQGHGVMHTGYGIQPIPSSMGVINLGTGTQLTGSTNQILLGNPTPNNALVYQKVSQQHSQQASRLLYQPARS